MHNGAIKTHTNTRHIHDMKKNLIYLGILNDNGYMYFLKVKLYGLVNINLLL